MAVRQLRTKANGIENPDMYIRGQDDRLRCLDLLRSTTDRQRARWSPEGMRFGVEDELVQADDVRRGEGQVKIFERLCQPETLWGVSVTRELGVPVHTSM